jgi:SNF2 family DNA or RNA helicase
MLKIIRNELESSNKVLLPGWLYEAEERLMEIDYFNSDREAVFLISLKPAEQTYFNKADIVIHFDPWRNPAVEIRQVTEPTEWDRKCCTGE